MPHSDWFNDADVGKWISAFLFLVVFNLNNNHDETSPFLCTMKEQFKDSVYLFPARRYQISESGSLAKHKATRNEVSGTRRVIIIVRFILLHSFISISIWYSSSLHSLKRTLEMLRNHVVIVYSLILLSNTSSLFQIA